MERIKDRIKKNKVTYAIAHTGKAAVYWCWGNGAELMFNAKTALVKKQMLRQDERFEAIKALKDSHRGERCFIVATGPSLTIADLEMLKDEFTISMNSIVNVLDQTSYRPSIYMVQDKAVWDKVNDKINLENVYIGIGNVGHMAGSCIKQSDVKAYAQQKGWKFYHIDTAKAWYNINFETEKFSPDFSADCAERIYDGCTVTYSAIQLAMYMGFSKVYLVGVDCNYKGSVRHIGEYDREAKFDKAEQIQRSMTNAYEVAYEYAKKHRIDFYNATRGGHLEVLPRMNLEDVLNATV